MPVTGVSEALWTRHSFIPAVPLNTHPAVTKVSPCVLVTFPFSKQRFFGTLAQVLRVMTPEKR